MVSAKPEAQPGAVLFLGGRSDIGGELARRLCPGRPVVLAARGNHGLEGLTAELKDLGCPQVEFLDFDATDIASHREKIESVRTR